MFVVLGIDLCSFYFCFTPTPPLKLLGYVFGLFFICLDCIKLLTSCFNDCLRFYKGFDLVFIRVLADM
jgi:hypothetical protein